MRAMRAMRAVAMGMALCVAFTSGVFAASEAPAKKQETTVSNIETRGALRVDRITTNTDRVTKDTFVVTLPMQKLQSPASLPALSQVPSIINLTLLAEKEEIASLEKNLLKEQTTSTGRLYFAFFSTQAEAQTFAKNRPTATSGVSPMARGRFGFGSYVETYGRITGGWHLYLSSRDAQYLFALGGTAAGTLIAWLGSASIISGPAVVIFGGIAAAALLTLYWREQNSDQSFEVWLPYLSLGMVPPMRPVKVGRHWYVF